jgi:hypothetical protein
MMPGNKVAANTPPVAGRLRSDQSNSQEAAIDKGNSFLMGN